MNSLYDVLRYPLVTEKSAALKSSQRKVTLQAAMWANKIQIKETAQKLFKVDVKDVHTSIFRGKNKRVGKTQGKQNNWKKAILTLAKGSDLDVFGMETPSGQTAEASVKQN